MTAAANNPEPRPPALRLDVMERNGAWHDVVRDPRFAERIAAAIEAVIEIDTSSTVVVALSDDADVQALNARFRDKDAPTNVLSFPAAGQPQVEVPGAPPISHLGDVIIALETMQREADAGAIRLDDHLSHLIVHGVLHLLGYDHETAAEADEMEAVEIDILAGLGIANPYTEELVDAG